MLHFPLACEKCEKRSAMPTKAVTVRGGGVNVDLRCNECGHEWQCHLPAALPAGQEKPERRQNRE